MLNAGNNNNDEPRSQEEKQASDNHHWREAKREHRGGREVLLLIIIVVLLCWKMKRLLHAAAFRLSSSLLLLLLLPSAARPAYYVIVGFVGVTTATGPRPSARSRTVSAAFLLHHPKALGSKNNKNAGRGPTATITTTTTTSRTKQQALQVAAVRVPNFCENCGSDQMKLDIPPGDDRERAVCPECDHVVYSNPKVVVACVILDQRTGRRCLLGKRKIEPRAGYWGFPQGFMEDGETSRQAAVREAHEELQLATPLEPSSLRLRAVYNVPGSVQLVYEARVDDDAVQHAPSTKECSAIAFFERDALPELCFPTVQWALDYCGSLSSENENNKIQQKTKAYDAAMDQWTEEEDEPMIDAKRLP